MGLLRLAVLGPPEVFHDSNRLTFSLRKAQALLLYLAVEGGMHPRSKLAAFLWPDSESSDARRTLRNALGLLRSLLADSSPAQHSHLLAEQDLLGLNPHAPLELDLDVVRLAWKQAQGLSTVPSEEQRAALVAQWQHALALVDALDRRLQVSAHVGRGGDDAHRHDQVEATDHRLRSADHLLGQLAVRCHHDADHGCNVTQPGAVRRKATISSWKPSIGPLADPRLLAAALPGPARCAPRAPPHGKSRG